MTHLYSLRSADGSYRVQKFDDELNPMFDSSYLISENFKECSCPAGHRPTCRHRQMIEPMLRVNLLDSPDFWNHDLNRVEPGQVETETIVYTNDDPEFAPIEYTGVKLFQEAKNTDSNDPTPQPFKRRF